MQGGLRDKVARMMPATSSYILNTHILLVQEAGKPDGSGMWQNDEITIWGRQFVCVVAAIDPYAEVNFRCTTCILVDRTIAHLIQETRIIGNVGYRPALGIKINGKWIMTIHDTADGKSWELKNLINQGFQYYEPWMLMGDLNCDPQSMSGYEHYSPCQAVPVNLGIHDRPKVIYEIYPRRSTQGPNGNRISTLDYILASGFMLPYLSNNGVIHMENEKMHDWYNNYLSDHNMISCAVDL